MVVRRFFLPLVFGLLHAAGWALSVSLPAKLAASSSVIVAPNAPAARLQPDRAMVHLQCAGVTSGQTSPPTLGSIAEIQTGDEVLAWDEAAVIDGQLSQASPLNSSKENQAKTATSARQTSASRYEKVSGVITSEVRQKLVHIALDNGKTITATQGHLFRTDEGWRDAILLKRGGKLLLKGSGDEESDRASGQQPEQSMTATIVDVRTEEKTTRVYNLEVENLHTFFVGDDGYVVHNGNGAYAGWFSDGSAYVGKGDEKRMRESMKRELALKRQINPNVTLRRCKQFKGAINNRDSFIVEDVIIERHRGCRRRHLSQ